jgi:hypothetical protein
MPAKRCSDNREEDSRMDVRARDERSWTVRACPICGAASVDPEDYVCTCVCALEAVEVVPASNLEGAVSENEKLRKRNAELEAHVEHLLAATKIGGKLLRDAHNPRIGEEKDRALSQLEGAVAAAEAGEQAMMDALSVLPPEHAKRVQQEASYVRFVSSLNAMRGQ